MSEEMTQATHFENPAWFDGKKINEAMFCEEFLRDYPMITVNGAFFTVNGRVHDENRLKKVIYDRIKYYVTSGIAKKVANLLDVMRMECCTEKLPLYQDRIHVANGTYYLNGTFSPEKNFCRNRLPVSYNPEAPQPVTWLHFLSQLLEPEDILTLQEFMGYCFIPSTKGQKMLLLIGKGGEGKSRIGIVLRALLGSNMNTGSIAKVETSPFARADLEHELVMLDDDMKLEALPQTNHIKAIITAELPMDLEKRDSRAIRAICMCALSAWATASCNLSMTTVWAFSADRLSFPPKKKTRTGKTIRILRKRCALKRRAFSCGHSWACTA